MIHFGHPTRRGFIVPLDSVFGGRVEVTFTHDVFPMYCDVGLDFLKRVDEYPLPYEMMTADGRRVERLGRGRYQTLWEKAGAIAAEQLAWPDEPPEVTQVFDEDARRRGQQITSVLPAGAEVLPGLFAPEGALPPSATAPHPPPGGQELPEGKYDGI